MALRWIANNTSRVMHIGGQMVLPGAGAFVDEPTPRSPDPSGTLDDTGYIVKGLPVIGSTLSVAFLPGYYPTASSTYAWFRSNILGALPIAGATGPAYLLTSQDDGFTVFPFVTNVAYSRIGVMVGQPAPEPAPPPPSSPPPLTITASMPGTATVGTAYSGSVAASGGTAPYTYSVFSGALPTGLSLNTSTGAVTGTPSVAATSSGLVFRVTDGLGAPANTAAQSIIVAASVADTRPRFFVAAASAYNTGTQAALDSATVVSGSSNGGKAGGPFTVSPGVGQYGWVAVLASASSSGVTFTDALGSGGWQGAGLAGNNAGASPSTSTSTTLFTDGGGTQWRLFRQDYSNSAFTGSIA